MRKYKIGAEIKTEQDLKDSISTLMDETNEFTLALIKKLVKNYCENAAWLGARGSAEKIVDEVLFEKMQKGEIVCNSGAFYHTEAVKSL